MITERANYLERLDDLRGQIAGLVGGLTPEALNWRPIPGGQTNSLAVLAAHTAGAEHFWIGEVVGGRPPSRNREAEFSVQATDAAEIVRLLDKAAEESREVLRALADSELDAARQVSDRVVPVRWCLLHVIDHTSLHLGHMQITYQLWTGGRSAPSPMWHERLPRRQEPRETPYGMADRRGDESR